MRVDDHAVLERAAAPAHRGFDAIDGFSGVVSAVGDNPFCGDTIEVRLALRDAPSGSVGPVIAEAAFEGYACTLCLACTDMLMEAVRGMSAADARALSFNDLAALFGGLEVGRTRKGCAELPLTVLKRALASGETAKACSQ